MPDLLSDNTKNNPTIPFRFNRLYVRTLILLAILLSVGQGLTQWRLSAVSDELYVIRYASLQRSQSQQIVKKALQLTDVREQATYNANLNELHAIFLTFERYHLEGRRGHLSDRDITIQKSDSIERLYRIIRPHFEAIQTGTRAILNLRNTQEANTPAAQASLQLLLDNEKPFLEQIDTIVRQYSTELRQKISRLQYIEFYLYLLTIAILMGIGLFIFRPAVAKLQQIIVQLVEAEKSSTLANKKLLSLNRSLKATRQKLFEATKQQHQQELNDQKLRTAYLIAGQEEERKRLSRELHDGLGQMLTAIKLQVEGLSRTRQNPNSTTHDPDNLNTLKNLIAQTIQETRSISNNLMPSVLSDFGIIPALKGLAEMQRQSGPVGVTLQTNLPPVRLDKQVEIMLYRVSQEAVSNALRHADPSHITINLFEKDDYLHLIVDDDGRGFQPQRSRTADGQGIHNMHERVELLNGKFRLTSSPGKGTKVQVSVPYYSQLAPHESDQTYAR